MSFGVVVHQKIRFIPIDNIHIRYIIFQNIYIGFCVNRLMFFSDEAIFYQNEIRCLAWQCQEEGIPKARMPLKVKEKAVMAWVGISRRGKTRLKIHTPKKYCEFHILYIAFFLFITLLYII